MKFRKLKVMHYRRTNLKRLIPIFILQSQKELKKFKIGFKKTSSKVKKKLKGLKNGR